jgi:hypothetical protein
LYGFCCTTVYTWCGIAIHCLKGFVLVCISRFTILRERITFCIAPCKQHTYVEHPNKDIESSLYFLVVVHCSSGPIFGAGADLFISSECNINKDSYSNLLHSYGNPLEISAHLFTGSYSFQVEDYEVFKPCSSGPFSTSI